MNIIDINGLNKYRERTVNDIINLLKINNKVACVRYTGFGKSYFIIPDLIRKLNSKCIIIVPSTPLYQQYKEYFLNDEKVIILTYQSIKHIKDENILQNFFGFKYIICDECHHLGKNKWRTEFDRFNKVINAKVIGFTATPIRGDSINVIDLYFNGIQVQPLELIDGISLGFLPKIKYIVAYAEIEDKFNSKLNEIDRYKIKNLLNISSILKKYIQGDNLQDNPKILVYVPNIKYINETIEQCKNWFSVFNGYNINVYAIHSNKIQKENYKILDEFKNKHSGNDIDILVSVDMVTEGLHLPNISIEIMLRKTKSPVKYFQQLGRVINNKQPIVLDLINNSRHIYQMKREYNIISNKINEHRQKVMFDNCINLIDETKEILEILSKYYDPRRIDDIIRLKVYNDARLGMEYKSIADKYDIAFATVQKILNEFNYYKFKPVKSEELHNIFVQNKQYLIESNGIIPRNIISKNVGLSINQLNRLYEMENIELKRVLPPIILSQELKDKFIDVHNNYNKLRCKTYIMEKLDITEKIYNALLRDKYVNENIKHSKPINNEKELEIVKYIKNNPNIHRTDVKNKFGIQNICLNKILKKYNLDLKYAKKQHKITEKEENLILKTFNQYGTLRGTSIVTGFHKVTIKNCLIKYGIEPPKPNRTNISITNSEQFNIYNDYIIDGISITALSRKYHRSINTIKKIIANKEINN